jgi:hypothetical protein
MQTVTTIGFDIAKSVFQVHGVDAGGGGYPPPVEASPCSGVLPEATAVSGRHRGLRLVPLLVARTSGTWSYRAIDAASLTKGLAMLPNDNFEMFDWAATKLAAVIVPVALDG